MALPRHGARLNVPRPRPRVAPAPPTRSAAPAPASPTRSIQTVLLGLGALVLGIAAVIFVGVLTELDPIGRLVILLVVAAFALVLALPVAGRGLVATAETVAAVGLVLAGVAGYALWTTSWVGQLPGLSFTGLVAAGTAGIGYGHHKLTGLAVPRLAALLLSQPVLPLLAAESAPGPGGWALVLTLVAAGNAAAGRWDRQLRWRWQRYPAWLLHGLALAAAVGFATADLVGSSAMPAALRAAGTLLLVGAVGLAGAFLLGRPLGRQIAAGGAMLAVIGAASRVVTAMLPGSSLLVITATMALAGAALLWLSPSARRGPAGGLALCATALGLVVAAQSLRAGVATVTAVLPPWPTDLTEPGRKLADAVPGTEWHLPTVAAAFTLAALAIPHPVRRELVAVLTGLTALAIPAGYGLSPLLTPWVLVGAAAAIGLAARGALTRRAAVVHLVAAGTTGLAAVGASLATPALTAAILTAVTVSATVVAWGRPPHEAARPVTEWAAGVATLTLPGAAAATAALTGWPPVVLVASFAGVCVALGYAALTQVAHGVTPVPVAVGTALAAVVAAGLTFTAAEATVADRGLAVLLAAGAILTVTAAWIDTVRSAHWRVSGGDIAAAVVTTGVLATLARATALLLPVNGGPAALVLSAGIVFLVAAGVQMLPVAWRLGPVLGLSLFGAIIAVAAGYPAVINASRALLVLWQGSLWRWPPEPMAGSGWAIPLALGMLALAAALALPGPARSGTSAVLAVLATVSAPIALGLDWWAPTVVSLAVATGYAGSVVSVPLTVGSRAARTRAMAAAALALHALAASIARPWTIATAFGVIAVVSVLVAMLLAVWSAAPAGRRQVGGTAVAVALLAGPAAIAAFALHLGHPVDIRILATLAGSGLGLAVLAILRDRITAYLPYGTFGVAAGGTAAALWAVPTPHPAGVYAAAAVLLAVLAELVRASADQSPGSAQPTGRSRLSPPLGAAIAAGIPTIVALCEVAPALTAALLDPYRVLQSPWQGPPSTLAAPTASSLAGATSVLAVLLLTLAAAIAMIGFGGPASRQAVPLVAPGLAITVLITPAALGIPWPGGTIAALAVAASTVLAVALTPPASTNRRARPVRTARRIVCGLGLAAGGAGLAGSLADPALTWGALSFTVAVGGIAALAGRFEAARLLGWVTAAVAAQLLALTTVQVAGLSGAVAAFFPLATAAVALLLVARVPRLRARPRELAVVEWIGGYPALPLAAVLAVGSTATLVAVLIGAGAVLAGAVTRPGQSDRSRRVLLWCAASSEVTACWVFLHLLGITVPEAYTLPLAMFALLVGLLEARHRPTSGSWVVCGAALIAALVPSLLLVVTTTAPALPRQAWVLLGGAAALIAGSRLGQRAPVIIGATVTAAGSLHLLSLAGPWLLLIPIGLLLLILGANDERRQRDLARIRGLYSRMR